MTKKRFLWLLALPAAAIIFQTGTAQQSTGDAKDKDALAKKGEAFVEAFHKADAKALAAFWAPDGEHTDQKGRRLKGHEAIEAAFKELFAANKGLKLRVDSESLRFITPDVAIEEGVTEVIPADGGPPTRARYTILHAKQNGAWHISSLHNSAQVAPSNAEHFQGLAWIVGDWAGERQTGESERLSLGWTDTQGFLVGTFSTTAKDVPLAGVHVWIGWDPIARSVRSWTFDETGAYGDGHWTSEGKNWIVKTASVLPDGTKAAATLILAPVDANSIALQVKDRSIGTERLPDVSEVKLKRVNQK